MMIICLIASFLGGVDAEPIVRIRTGEDATRIEVLAPVPDGLRERLPAGKLTQEQGERWLRLALLDAETGREGPPIFGNYERRQNVLVFTPRYALAAGQRYRATVEWTVGESHLAEHRVPLRKAAAPAVVENVFPSTAVLPANQLKFYVHFSKPMRESRDIFDHIKLLDARGKPVADPWRHTELWSADGRRLTLWIHPGRIKEGVNLREELGPALRPHQEYRLVIETDLLDADGQTLSKPFVKKFRTTAAERSRPLVDDWKLTAPTADSRHPLVLEFPRPFDRALLDRFLTVEDSDGRLIPGRIEVGPEERSWSFHPDRPWRAADYTVRVDGRLEDLAGNTPLRLFDVDLEQPVVATPRLTIVFRPTGRPPP